jgi:prepilin-type N-terminal cleavage/methylation domain-containing protein
MSAPFLPALRRRLREERGLSLIEMLLTMSLFVVVVAAATSVMDTAQRVGPRDTERANAIREQQVSLDRMVNELRQAYQVLATSPRSMEVLVRLRRPGGHQNLHVAYSCNEDAPGKCIRKETIIGQPLPATGKVVIDRVLNWSGNTPPVFEFPDDFSGGITPEYVNVRVQVPAKGTRPDGFKHTVTLEDGYNARNARVVGFES